VTSRRGRGRVVLFVTTVVLALGLAGGYSTYALMRSQADVRPTAGTRADRALDLGTVLSGPHVVFRSTSMGPTYGRIAAVPLARPAGPRAVTGVECERVYSTGTTGLCLSADRGVVTTYETHLLDDRLLRGQELETAGLPSRARVSPDGRMAATTTFVTGHSYAQTGFSTRTTVYDVASGRALHNLEEFRVLRDGEVYRSPDINVWGVTFTADSNTFYATVSSRGTTYLARGDVRDRTLRTLRENVECPSVSPDGSRVAYKKRDRSSGSLRWRLHVLDLSTGAETPLAERRSVDDQVEWLDDGRVVYGLPRDESALSDVWVVPADGSGEPAVLVPRAWSPAVVR
jgi:dipeptidyl aminopeptidase/acylaminoacyl peptidase